MQTCSAVTMVYSVEWALFTVAGIACWVFGTHRGVPLKRVNFSESSYIIYLVATLATIGSQGALCYSSAVAGGTDDLPLVRPLIFAVMLAGCSVLVSRRLSEDAPFVTMHERMAVVSQVPMLVSLLSEERRALFAYSSVMLTFGLLLHIWAESKAAYSTNSKFSAATLWWLVAYAIVYYLVVLWGPWYQQRYSLVAQEITLMCADVVVALRICVLIAHYGWAAKLAPQALRPGDLSAMPADRRQHTIDRLHSPLGENM